MKKKFRKYFQPHMLRPILYRAFVMLVLAVLAALLWDRFVNTAGYLNVRTYVFPVLGVFFLAAAWFGYLRMDWLARPGSAGRKKKEPPSGMFDAIQTDPDNGEELEPDERAFCFCAASLLCGVLCLLISLI